MRKAVSFLGGFCLAAALLLGITWLLGTSAPLLTALMRKEAPPHHTALPESEYEAVGNMTAAYLKGRTAVFQHQFERDGSEYLCFNATEQRHMADCRLLFRLCGLAALLLAALGLAASLAAGQRSAWLKGLLAPLALCALLAIWAAIDFDSLFVRFHRLFFRNELWLLNPATDLLIRLMPTRFFIDYAALIAGLWALGCAALAGAAHLTNSIRNRVKQA